MNVPFAHQEDPQAFIEGLNAGTETMADNQLFKDYVNLMDLFSTYSYDDLMTMSYNDQVGNFALEKTAVLHQGNWTLGMLEEITPGMNIAFLPIPLNDDADGKNDTIPVGVPNFWSVNKNSPETEKEAAKLFLDYMASSERGGQFLVEDCNFIPAFSNVEQEVTDPLGASILEYSAAGKTVPWIWAYYPNGFLDPSIKDAIQQYYIGVIDQDGFLNKLDADWQKMLEQNN